MDIKRCKKKRNKIKGAVNALRYICKQQIKWYLGLTVNGNLKKGVEKHQSCSINDSTKNCRAFPSPVATASLAAGVTAASSHRIQQKNF